MAKTENEVLMAENERKEVDSNNNSDNNTCNKECDNGKATAGKYQLRPRSLQSRRRSDSEWSFHEPLRQKRPPPLSRYRRKTANARERYRMRQINTAFENLRGVLPSWVCSRRAASEMTKIATLKLASAYIRSLQDILDGNAHHDTCSWVLSTILDDDSPRPKAEAEADPHTSPKCQVTSTHMNSEADLMSLLCGSSSESPLSQEDNLDASFSYLSSGTEPDPITLLLLESESQRYWSEGQHSPLMV
ncbi:basic helix-loop-helix transcription factor scleraxis-like [Macrobrachium nipponense]|uniref:basic helix-loop-helix transcription factor scleraxis-like n=1 Tax=Macrobrachium nipponense TaxID=159736 RepID=UPI0030C85D4B